MGWGIRHHFLPVYSVDVQFWQEFDCIISNRFVCHPHPPIHPSIHPMSDILHGVMRMHWSRENMSSAFLTYMCMACACRTSDAHPYDFHKILFCILKTFFHIVLIHLIICLWMTSTTPSCSGSIPAQNSRGNSVLGVIFSHTMPKMDFRYSHRFSWERNTLITCHGYNFINIHHSPFIGPTKMNQTFWKITPLGSWRSWNEIYVFPLF